MNGKNLSRLLAVILFACAGVGNLLGNTAASTVAALMSVAMTGMTISYVLEERKQRSDDEWQQIAEGAALKGWRRGVKDGVAGALGDIPPTIERTSR
jgi:hypothetical protein